MQQHGLETSDIGFYLHLRSIEEYIEIQFKGHVVRPIDQGSVTGPNKDNRITVTVASAVISIVLPLPPRPPTDRPVNRVEMFGLIRRISHSVIPRLDRPWADDREFLKEHSTERKRVLNDFFLSLRVVSHLATSNAPTKGKKRRLSSTERDADPDMEESIKKKARGESTASSTTDVNDVPQVQVETQEVREVTQGVKEVELADAVPVLPAAIPLPEEVSGELDELSSSATPPPEVQPPKAETIIDVDDDASSVNEEPNDSTAVLGDVAPSEKGEEGTATSAIEEKKAVVKDVAEPQKTGALPNETKADTTSSAD
ncbi:hypothetical protein Hypma_013159 [Hypsizygus marmoreus]|uniref:Uncharacterized protein n=1 Tax=Hypsizygus marmoreus TaxID=39966 RepID=A0A369JEW5_HYPMA|nr:hypothetical protein Hypma_013159 [Hypsizygus marmoreus]